MFAVRSTFICSKSILKRANVSSQCVSLAKYYCTVPATKNDHLDRIYTGDLTSLVKRIKLFSFVNSTFGIAATPYLYTKSFDFGTLAVVGTCGMVGIFTYVTPILLHMVAKKYVTHMDYNKDADSYDAYTLSFFMRPKKVTFTPEDVHIPELPGVFTTFKIKGNSLLVDMRKMKHTDHYGRIMGYDKPLDFEYDEGEKKK